MNPLRRLLRTDRAKMVLQTIIIVLLVIVAWQVYALRDRANDEASTNAAIQSIIAQTCGVASFEELERRGLVEECRLAQKGKLAEAIPADKVDPKADPTEINPDLVDDGDTGKQDISPAPLPQGPTNAQVDAAVDDWFDANPLTAEPGYLTSLRRTVAVYLTENPPKDGRPPTDGEIRNAVQAALMANPPADGSDGRGIVNTSLNDCDIVFSYSDGSTNRVGPVCGPKGEKGDPPTAEQIQNAFGAYCSANGGCVGPPGVVNVVDNCPPITAGEQIADVNLTPPDGGQTMVLSCEYAPILGPNPGNGNGGGGGTP